MKIFMDKETRIYWDIITNALTYLKIRAKLCRASRDRECKAPRRVSVR